MVSAIVITFAFSIGIINTDSSLKAAFAEPPIVPKASLGAQWRNSRSNAFY